MCKCSENYFFHSHEPTYAFLALRNIYLCSKIILLEQCCVWKIIKKKSILIHQIQNKIHSNFSFSLYTAFYANQPSSTSKNSFLYFSFISPKGNHSLDIEQRTERGSEHVASEKRGKEKWNFFHFTEHRRRTEEWECCSFL